MSFPPSAYSGVANNPYDIMLSFMLLLFFKNSNSICFWCAIVSKPLSPSKCLFSKAIELAYALNADWTSLILNLFLIACLVSICLTLPSLKAPFALFKVELLYSLVFCTDNNLFVKTFDMGLFLLYLNFFSSMIMDFNSFLPLFGISVWEAYRVVSILCHFGSEPTNGHYQCLYISSGSSWLTDDDRAATLCPVMDPLRRAAYLFWLVPHEELSLWWRRPIEQHRPSEDLSDLLATAFPWFWRRLLVRVALMLTKHPWQNAMQPNTGVTRLKLEVNEWMKLLNR